MIFTEIVVTAPSEKIASVYRLQLSVLKKTSSSLQNTQLYCVADPIGCRIGSGGGTINAIDFLCINVNNFNPQKSKVLIIHSGGDSRRAPLYSLCGKAWTTINALVDGEVIANPLVLLIYEISKFCVQLPNGSLVVASSDVMLDICKVDSVAPEFAMDAVSLVCLPENPITAKNHGVMVGPEKQLFEKLASDSSAINPYYSSPAVKYLQKPTLQAMADNNCLYSRKKQSDGLFIDNSLSSSRESQNYDNWFALVDSGVVVFTGVPFQALVNLSKHPVVERCTARWISTMTTPSNASSILRFELYFELVNAFSLKNQRDYSLDVYLSRLGLLDLSTVPVLYADTIRALWDSFRRSPLNMVYVVDGQFEHLGTTEEVLDLFSLSTEKSIAHDVGSYIQHQKNLCFSRKYSLQRRVCSHTDSDDDTKIFVNSVATKDFTTRNRIAGKPSEEASLIEHSLLSGKHAIGKRCIISHINCIIGRGLVVPDQQLLQQVYLSDEFVTNKLKTTATSSGSNSLPITLLQMHLKDNVKGLVEDSNSTVCGMTWQTLFDTAKVSVEAVWDPEIAAKDRTLWNAKLFCAFVVPQDILNNYNSFGWKNNSGISVLTIVDGIYYPTTLLTCSWLQQLSVTTSSSNGNLTNELVNAIADWKKSERLSLADILGYGDASRMFMWRIFCSFSYEASSCYSMHMEKTITHYFEMVAEACKSLGEFIQKPAANTTTVDSAVWGMLLSLWCCKLLLVRDVIETQTGGKDRRYSNKIIIHDEVLSYGIAIFCRLSGVKLHNSTDTTMNVLTIFNNLWENVANQSIIKYSLFNLMKSFVKSSMILDAMSLILKLSIRYLEIESYARSLLLLSCLASDANFFISKEEEQLLIDEIAPNLATTTMLGSMGKSSSINDIGSRCKAILLVTETHFNRWHDNFRHNKYLDVQRCKGTILFEGLMQKLVELQLSTTLEEAIEDSFEEPLQKESIAGEGHKDKRTKLVQKVYLASAPARIDIAGGWSDTPPICYELGGAVFNLAVKIDDRNPIRCVTRLIEEPLIRMHSLRRDEKTKILVGDVVSCISLTDMFPLDAASNTILPLNSTLCALLKAALIVLKLVPNPYSSQPSLMKERPRIVEWVMENCGIANGLEIACISDLPAGSGMGGSSILAAAVLQSISSAVGKVLTHDHLINLVSQVEQVLTTGGGWQDQLGGIYGGFKLGYCNASLPIKVERKFLQAPAHFVTALEMRMHLVYTGQQRLAKNTLMNALRKYAITPNSGRDTSATINRLKSEAEQAFYDLEQTLRNAVGVDEETCIDSAVNLLAKTINRYWQLKKEMADGSEPTNIRQILHHFSDITCGMSLCGAGAGGFAVLILKADKSKEDLFQRIKTWNSKSNDKLCWYSTSVDFTGTDLRVIDDDNVEDIKTFLI